MPELLNQARPSEQQPAIIVEKSPTLGIAQGVLARIKRTRHIGGVELAQLDKTGSRLDFVTSQEHHGVVRNAELPASSMAAWEFMQTYAHTLFPEEIKRQLFGVWDRAQVAPILQRPDGSNRVYYRKNLIGLKQGGAYSELVGFTTPQLAELWGIKDLHEKYAFQEMGPGLQDLRSRDSVTYWLAKNLTEDLPELGNNGELMSVLEEWWEEFTQLNESKVVPFKKDEFAHKEVAVSTVFTDDPFLSSLHLIELSHRVAAVLRVQIAKLDENPTNHPKWRDGPVKETLLYLLHNQQATAQQMVMWWLGVAHGHLHSNNTVSRVQEGEGAVSPLQTYIIDFDAARLSVSKLQENRELYSSIDGQKIHSLLMNETIGEPLKMHLLAYLPLADWDTEIYSFFSRCDMNVRDNLLKLVARRSATEKIPSKLYRVLLFATYRKERKDLRARNSVAPHFPLTLELLRNKSDEVELPLAKNIAPYITGGDDSVPFNTLSGEEQLLILGALEEKTSETQTYKVAANEWRWLVDSLNTTEPIKRLSKTIIKKMLLINDPRFADLFRQALTGAPDALDIIREIWLTFYLSGDPADISFRKLLIQQIVVTAGDKDPFPVLKQVIDALGLNSLPSNQAALLRVRLLDNVAQYRQFNPSEQEIKRIMEDAVSI